MKSLLHHATRLWYFLLAVAMLSCHHKSSTRAWLQKKAAMNKKPGIITANYPPSRIPFILTDRNWVI